MKEQEYHSSAGNFTREEKEAKGPDAECEIVFAPEHVLCQLWAIWTGQDARGQSLRLSLAPEEPDHPFPVSDPAREAKRIQVLLTRIAKIRVSQLAARADADEMAIVIPALNEMMAWLFLLPPVGRGTQLSASQLHQALLRRGVTYGINWNAICSISDCPHRYFYLFPIAFGRTPIPGRDGEILDRYPRVLEEAVPVNELGQADYETLNLVQEIHQGDIICEIVAPTAGISGHTVMGKSVPAPRGKRAEVPQGRNTCLSEDGAYLLAERDGHLCFSGQSFQVRPVLDLYETSESCERNIKFLGDVHIHGDLCSGATVCAIGNVQIDGAVEICTVEAGENIIVSSGVQGQGRAVLRAQKSIYAKYLENCNVYAQKSVQADCIINCGVYSNGDVRVRTGRGIIIGGTIRAAREVSAATMGSKAERATLIMLGGQPCEEAERAQILEQIQDMEEAMEKLSRQGTSDACEQQKSKLRLSQCVAKMKLEKIDKDLEEQAEACIACDQRQMCCDTAYPGTTVSMDHKSYRVEKEEHSCVIRFSNGFLERQ